MGRLNPTASCAVHSDVPTLFISGTLDANARASQADEIAARLSRAVSILVENAGHKDTLPLVAVQQRLLAFLPGERVSSERLTTTLPAFLPVYP